MQTDFGINAGGKPRDFNPTKLEGTQIAHLIKAILEMDDKGFIPEAGTYLGTSLKAAGSIATNAANGNTSGIVGDVGGALGKTSIDYIS